MATVAQFTRVLAVALPKKPRLPSWALPVDLGDGRLQFRSPRSVLTVATRELVELFCRLRDQLDGSLTVDELISRAPDGVDPKQVVVLLKILRAHGFLQEGAVPAALLEADVLSHQGVLTVLGQLGEEPLLTYARLRAARVLLTGDGGISRYVAEALDDCGVVPGTTTAAVDCDLLIGCFDGAGLAEAKKVNAGCVEAGVRFLPLFVDGPAVSLGPTVIPHETACLECLEYRRLSARPDVDEWARYRREVETRGDRDTGLLPPLARIAAGQVALEAVRLLTSIAPPVTVGVLVELSLDSPLGAAHAVLKVPRCEVCARRSPLPEAWDVKLAPLDQRS
jgi:bacteriocin biosynthesis cyclodehydratase domain-containing protein